MTRAILVQFNCSECGNVNWLYTERHAKLAEDYCVRCNEETTHERLNSKGR